MQWPAVKVSLIQPLRLLRPVTFSDVLSRLSKTYPSVTMAPSVIPSVILYSSLMERMGWMAHSSSVSEWRRIICRTGLFTGSIAWISLVKTRVHVSDPVFFKLGWTAGVLTSSENWILNGNSCKPIEHCFASSYSRILTPLDRIIYLSTFVASFRTPSKSFTSIAERLAIWIPSTLYVRSELCRGDWSLCAVLET